MGVTESGIVYPDASSPIAPTPDGLQGYFQAMAESIDASLGGASAKMKRTAAQSIPNAGSGAFILWDTTVYSRGGALTSTAGIQVPEDGLYDIAGQLAIVNSGTAGLFHVSVTGASEGGCVLARGSSWSATAPSIIGGAARLQCTAGDILSLAAYQTNGAARDTSTGIYQTALSVSWAGKL